MDILRLILGFFVLLTGRRLFWLFVGAAGFVAGMNLASELQHNRPDWVIVAIAVGLGVAGALLAVAFQGVAIAFAGFFAGSYALWVFLTRIGWNADPFLWAGIVIGGAAGAVLMLMVFDWALIVLSSLMGASLIVESLGLRDTMSMILLALCFVIGLVVQGSVLIRQKR